MADIKQLLELSYKPQKTASEAMGKKGYEYDPELSSMQNKVYVKDGQPIITYRGSKTVADWVDNAKLALGMKSKAVDNAIRLAEKTKQKYGVAPITVGHSRGGYMAEKAGERVQGKTITYNKAVLPVDIGKTIRKDQTDIRTNLDLVSLPSITQRGKKRTINVKANPIKAHDLKYLK